MISVRPKYAATGPAVEIVAAPYTLPSVHDATLPERYIAAQNALADCSSIDECKEWQDRAAAMASYARQAQDEALEKMAQRIRARAVRRLGELLRAQKETVGLAPGGKPYQQPPTGNGTEPVDRAPTLAEAGISKKLSHQAQRVAAIPEPEFEAAVEADEPPSVAKLAASISPPAPPKEPQWLEQLREEGARPGFREATTALGSLRTFAEFCEANDPLNVSRGVLPHEVADARRQVGVIDGWLDRFITNLET